MKLKRYCVTVMDNWTPTRTFWTARAANGFYEKHMNAANMFKWDGECWCWIGGAAIIDRMKPPDGPCDLMETAA